MEQAAAPRLVITRFLRYGAALGATVGVIVTGVLAAWAIALSPVFDWLSTALVVAVGAIAGAAIGTVSGGLAGLVHDRLADRVPPRALMLSTAAAAGVGASGCWFVGSRRDELIQPVWMLISVGVVAAAVTVIALAWSRQGVVRHDRRSMVLVIGEVVTLVGVAGLGTAGAGIGGVGPLASRLGFVETTAQPVAFARSGDPHVLQISVAWPQPDSCSGQFTIDHAESPTEVRLSDAVSRADRNLWSPWMCVGSGTADGLAGVELQLTEPLGDRSVVRASDGVELPVAR